MVEMIDCVCEHCQKVFAFPRYRLAYNRGRYCSKRCMYDAQKKQVSIVCGTCGKVFEMSKFKSENASRKGVPAKYCSVACAHSNPDYRAAISKANQIPKPVTDRQRAIYDSSEWRERVGRQSKERWANPEMKSRMLSGIKRRSQSEKWRSAAHFQKGKAHPRYKPNSGKSQRSIEYQRYEYKTWRKAVYERDNYTCQKCNKRGGRLEAHHIKPWSDYPEVRFDVNNGMTLCETCHAHEHKREPKRYTCVVCGAFCERSRKTGVPNRCRDCIQKKRR